MRIRGRVVVVTGASSGIGRATALAFAQHKAAAVVLAARREDALEDLARDVEKAGARALVVPVDVADEEEVRGLADRAVEEFGRIDVWVNDAAVSVYGAVEELPLEDVRRVLDVDVMGYLHGIRAALPLMRDRGEGVIVNIASVLSVVPQPYGAPYSMAKAAVLALAGSVRSELRLEGQTGIHVVSVLPTTVDTPFFHQAGNHTGRRLLAMPPVNAPQRVAEAVVEAVRKPRREVPVGSGAAGLVRTARKHPDKAERLIARQVDTQHLSRRHGAAPTSGNLHRPSPVRSDAAVEGGWHGRSRTGARRVALVAAAVGSGLAVRRLLAGAGR
ncbi:SDR family oxidoreductase [Actinotalea sp. Marseille-Q4924]|uniref:SDR family oxidoreductase n=1 Tax=Actinotalea sp. Marseille-Q4924 TaxID=2866571 RepID=UPI001CE4692C|nr:SDR family oxidoreductase [Actinotalea sp. Marseille-Q4924]